MGNAIGLVLAGAAIGGALFLGQRYELARGNDAVAWRLDRLTGKTCLIVANEAGTALETICEP